MRDRQKNATSRAGERTRAGMLVALCAMALVAALVPLVPAGAVNVPHAVIVSDDPSDVTPHVLDGKVEAIAQVGSTIVAGGKFNEVRNAGASTRFPRTNLFAFDAATGQISQTFAPQLDGTVETLAASPDGTSVYVGGTFKNVDGQAQKKIARLDVATGARVGNFKPNPNAAVKDIVVRGSTVYLAGDFKKVKNIARGGIAAVDASTGALSADLNIPFTEPRLGSSPSVNKIDVTPDAATLIAIGNFKRADGQVREQIGMIDLSTTPDSLANWQTNRFPAAHCSSSFDTYMRDVDISPDGSYFAVATTGAYGGGPPVLCDTVSRWETGARGSNLQPTWVDYTGGDTLYSVAITGTAIYVGGHQRWMNNPFAGDSKGPGAVDRPGIAAIDPNNGVPFSWNPGRSRGVGAFALVSTTDGLYVGSDTDKLGGEFHARMGMFPVAGGTTPPVGVPGTLPGELYRVETNGAFTKRAFNGTTYGTSQSTGASLPSLRGAMMLSGNLYHGASDGKFYVRSFDGSTLGSATQIPTLGLESRGFAPQNLTGLFYDNHRVYYTISGRNGLFYRSFTLESNILGGEEFTATTGGGISWGSVKGMTMASGALVVAVESGNGQNKTGKLYRVNWANGAPSGAVTQIGGSGVDSIDWRSLALFVLAP